MPAYATTYARDPSTGQVLFDSYGNPQYVSNGTPSSNGPNITAVDFYRDAATGQVQFDINGYPLFFQDSFWNDGGILALWSDTVVEANGYPTDPTGLVAGAIYSNELAVCVVLGMTPDPDAPLLYFGSISPAELLETGGGNLPLTPGPTGSLQLWNDGGQVAIS